MSTFPSQKKRTVLATGFGSTDTGSSVEGAPLEERGLVGYADQWTRVAREHHDRAAAEDGIDGATLVAELAKVAAAEY